MRHATLAFGDSAYANFCGFGRALDAKLADLGSTTLLARQDCEPDDEEGCAAWQARLRGLLGDEAAPPRPTATVPLISRTTPAVAPLCRNERLTPAASDRDTRLIGFDIAQTGLSYEPGDALGVWPRNRGDVVERVLSALKHSGDTSIDLRSHGTTSLRAALTAHLDLSRASAGMQAHLGMDAGYLPDMLETSGRAFSPGDIPALFRKLQPRLYSIASSPLAHPGEVHLTMGVANDPYPGTCSSWLAALAPGEGASLFVQKSGLFRLPADGATPIVMIGPGTGIAPFRGFLHHRAAMNATGGAWLFFGERNADSGFYYRDELAALQQSGTLSCLDVAFSRDQEVRVYVQDRMIAAGPALWEWIARGAHVYVCGDARRMARDVDAALRQIVAIHGDMDAVEAAGYVDEMAKAGRYARDVY